MSTPPPTPRTYSTISEDVYQRPDEVLATIVASVNRVPAMETALTLYLPGGIVSGFLISGRAHFEQLQRELRAAGGEVRGVLADKFEQVIDNYRGMEQEQGPVDADSVAVIHLRDATVHGRAGLPIQQGLWRGRLVSVSGWSLGLLTQQDQPE